MLPDINWIQVHGEEGLTRGACCRLVAMAVWSPASPPIVLSIVERSWGDFKQEMGKLAYRLMYNPHAPDPNARPSPQTCRGSPPCSPCGDDDDCTPHVLRQLNKFNQEHNIKKKTCAMKCSICAIKKTSWYCVTCTKGPKQLIRVCPSHSRGGGKGGKGTKEHECEQTHTHATQRSPWWQAAPAEASAPRSRGCPPGR